MLSDLELMGAYESEQQGRFGDHVRSLKAVEAAVLAKLQAQGEPVAWMTPMGNVFAKHQLTEAQKADLHPLYTHPAPVQQEPTTSHSAKRSAGSAESFCNDEMEGTGEYVHLCKGVLVTGVRGEVCNRCGKELG